MTPIEGMPVVREARFGIGVGHIYLRVKAATLLVGARRQLLGESQAASKARWDAIHDSIGSDLGRLCAALGGFNVKVGQFFSSRPDLVPEQWCRQLSVLCDAVDPLPSSSARAIAEEQLGLVFSEWVDAPLGSASVAQVHAARLTPTTKDSRGARGKPVAIKVRRPETRHFERDLRSVRAAAGLLQRFELDFDLLTAIDELRDRVTLELDFRNEFENLQRADSALRRASGGAVAAPLAIAATESCLVTELIDGDTFASLARAQHAAERSGGSSRDPALHSAPLSGRSHMMHSRRLLRDGTSHSQRSNGDDALTFSSIC